MSTEPIPESREADGCVSPSLMYATCRYRWQKTIIVTTDTVVFVTINNKDIEPIKLEWDTKSDCFYSDEFKIPVGTFAGHLVVDGTFYPVEDVEVKHYTFEVDIYLKDDSLDGLTDKMEGSQPLEEKQDNVTPANSPVSVTSQTSMLSCSSNKLDKPDGAIHLSSKYEQLVRSQMIEKSADSDSDIEKRLKPDFPDLNGRGTPVGEDSKSQYQDNNESKSSIMHMAQEACDSIKNALLDDYLRKSNNSTPSYKLDNTVDQNVSIVGDELGNGFTRTSNINVESPVFSHASSRHSSARQTPITLDNNNQDRCSSVGSVQSTTSLSRNMMDDLINEAVIRDRKAAADESQEEMYTSMERNGRDSKASNERESPLVPTMTRKTFRSALSNGSASPEQIADVLSPADRHSPIRQEFLSGPPFQAHSPKDQAANTSQQGSTTSQRSTPKELISPAFRSSQEKLYSEVKARLGNETGSNHSNQSSQPSSRPQSVTSEQELSQYYVNMTETRPVPTQNGQRVIGATSLPAVGAKRLSSEKCSYTPDNLVRVPQTGPVKPTYVPPKTPPQSPYSNASSRTVTPINTVTDEEKLREHIQELEYVTNGQVKLLDARDAELSQLRGQLNQVKETNRQLESDLQLKRGTPTHNTEMEDRLQDMSDECHILRRQVRQLQDELETRENSLNSYNPNNPDTLKRKIKELNSQMQDLQEAHETTVSDLNSSESRVKDLAGELENLRLSHSDRVQQIEDDNRFLKSEVMRLKEERVVHNEATDYRLRIELQQLKEDNRSLRERNYRLHDENIKQKEDLSELRKAIGSGDSMKRTPTGRKTPTENWKGDLSWERSQSSTDITRSRTPEYSTDRQPYTSKQTRTLQDISPADLCSSDRYRRKLSGGDDWVADDKYKSYTQPLSLDRPKAIGQSQYSMSLTADRGRHERRRTTSIEKEFKSSNSMLYNVDLDGHDNLKPKSQYKQVESKYEEDGNDSDTPTDILCGVAVQPQKPSSKSWGHTRPRSGSVGSEDSNGSYSDTEEKLRESVRQRSKSADGREIMKWKLHTFPGTSKKRDGKLSPPPTGGLRSISPRPLVTQHNKSSLLLSSSLNSLTQGLRPFAPRSAGDLQIHDVIKFSRQGGKLSQGIIKFIGHLPGRGDIYLGVELDREDGKHDGVFEGIRYFKCKPNKGVFVAYNKVVMAWTSQ